MKTKRLMALMLVILMVISLVACNNNKKTVSSTSNNTESTADENLDIGGDGVGVSGGTASKTGSTNTGGLTQSNVDTNASKDLITSLKGLEVKVLLSYAPAGQTAAADRQRVVWKTLEKKYGIKFTPILRTANDANGQITKILANSPDAQIISFSTDYLTSFVKANALADLTPGIKTAGVDYSNKVPYDLAATKWGNINSKQYAIANGDLKEGLPSIVYNAKMIKDAGLTEPFDLWKNGQWTFAKLEEYATKLKKTSGNTVSVWGLETFSFQEIVQTFTLANGGGLSAVDASGKIAVNMKSAKNLEALNMLQKWAVTDKILSVPSGPWDQAISDFLSGKCAMVYNGDTAVRRAFSYNMKDPMGAVPVPYGPSSNKNVPEYASTIWFYAVPVTYQKDVAKYQFILDQMFKLGFLDRDANAQDLYQGFGREDNKQSYIERVQYKSNFLDVDPTVFPAILWQSNPNLNSISTPIYSGDLTPVAAIDKFQDALQGIINQNTNGLKFTGK